MVLTQEKFDSLVKELESYAYRKPKDFRKRVFFLAVIGYGYILMVLSFLLWVIVTILSIKTVSGKYGSVWVACIFVIALILFGIIIRSLWVTIPKPKGRRLRRKETPNLFKFVDELSIVLKAPKFHNIILTNELNATDIKRPRCRIYGSIQY